MPCSAASKPSGSFTRAGGPAVMNVPAPWRVVTTPMVASERRPAHVRPADADRAHQLALRGETIAGAQGALLDQAAHVGDHLLGSDGSRAVRLGRVGDAHRSGFYSLDRQNS